MTINSLKGRLWLCIPVIITDILDATLTMLGQSAEYWKGAYHLVNEANPVARWFLGIHPLGIVIYTILDFAFVAMLIIILPSFLSKILSVAWTVGSAKAIYNWSFNRLGLSWVTSNFFIFIPVIILVYALERANIYAAKKETPPI